MTMRKVKKMFGDNSMYIQQTNGSFNDNYKYCTKKYNLKDELGDYTIGGKARWDDKNSGPFEFGEPNKQDIKSKKDNDYFSSKFNEHEKLKKSINELKNGKKLKDVIIDNCIEIPSWGSMVRAV
jgi:hypothetical protein